MSYYQNKRKKKIFHKFKITLYFFLRRNIKWKNPYGKGGASSKILQILSKEILDLSSNKDFYDLNNIKNLIKNKKK